MIPIAYQGESMKLNYSFGCSTSKPNGCLLNPEGSRMIFFEECKNSPKPSFKIYTHLSIQITLENLEGTNPLKNSI